MLLAALGLACHLPSIEYRAVIPTLSVGGVPAGPLPEISPGGRPAEDAAGGKTYTLRSILVAFYAQNIVIQTLKKILPSNKDNPIHRDSERGQLDVQTP